MYIPAQISVIRLREIDKLAYAKDAQGIVPSATCTPWRPQEGVPGICRRECCTFRGLRTRCSTEYKACGT